MSAARRILAVSVAVSLLLLHNADAQAAGSSASDASTVSSGEYAKVADLLLPPSLWVVHGLVRYFVLLQRWVT